MMSLRFVSDLFFFQSCLQNATYRGCHCGFTCQSHIPGAQKKPESLVSDVGLVVLH
jgi:hypothetical protein